MAGESRAEAPRCRDRARLLRVADPCPLRAQPCDMGLESAGGGPALALVIDTQLVDVAELPLPRRMVHKRQEAYAILGAELRQLLDQRLGADFRPQVDMVADPERPAFAQRQQVGRQTARIGAIITPVRGGADTHRVEHGRDARTRKLPVMGDERGLARPVDAGARLDMPLQVVGMQLHQTGDQQVAVTIDPLRPR